MSAIFCCFKIFDVTDSRVKTERHERAAVRESKRDRVKNERRPLLDSSLNIPDAERRAHQCCKNIKGMISRGAKAMLRRTNEEIIQYVVNKAEYEEEKPVFRRIAQMYRFK